MKVEKFISNNEELGEDHVQTSDVTPIREDAFEKSDEEKISIIKKSIREIMHTLGLDLNDDSLIGTPARVAKMFVKEIFSGLKPDFRQKSSTPQPHGTIHFFIRNNNRKLHIPSSISANATRGLPPPLGLGAGGALGAAVKFPRASRAGSEM